MTVGRPRGASSFRISIKSKVLHVLVETEASFAILGIRLILWAPGRSVDVNDLVRPVLTVGGKTS
jgi:hypothetical protein